MPFKQLLKAFECLFREGEKELKKKSPPPKRREGARMKLF